MDWKDNIRSGPFSADQANQFISWISKLDHAQLQWLRGYFTGLGANPGLVPLNNELAKNSEKEDGNTPALLILYGTQTGNSQKLASVMEKKSKFLKIETTVQNMAFFKAKDFRKVKNLAVIVSTQGIGEPPIEAAELHSLLQSSKISSLKHIQYSVLSLGDTSYSQFCQTGKDFDSFLEKLDAIRLHPRKDCDVDYEDEALTWMDEVLAKISSRTPEHQIKLKDADQVILPEAPKYSRKNPFSAAVLAKINLNGRGSSKETFHIELSIKDSGIKYKPGDSLGVYAENSAKLIEAVLAFTKLSGNESVKTHVGEKKLIDALKLDYELTPLTALSLNRYTELTDSVVLRKILSNQEEVARYIYGRDILDLLKEFPFKMDGGSLISILRKNTPRMYSIASSLDSYEDEAHLLVSALRYQSHCRVREGLCSCFLADRVQDNDRLRIFIDSNSRFRLPVESNVPIIMIGAGTGVAPYRAFMQQRENEDSPGKSWLFFGERNFTTDFLYQTEWQQYLKKGILTKVNVAFSRDTGSKIYVQDKIKENGKSIYTWLDEGAHIYICGDANKMAKDVNNALKEVVSIHGNMNAEKAEEYLKYLQLSERYQLDVY